MFVCRVHPGKLDKQMRRQIWAHFFFQALKIFT